MIRLRWALLGVCLALNASLAPSPARATVAPVSTSCPPQAVILGADLTSAQRAEVVARLGAPSARVAVYLTESLAGETAQAGGLVPPELLGISAISSALLTRLPPRSGLTVRTDRSITLDSAALYANALLTAGLRDARVQVAAPLAAPALGTTALLGLLRGARQVCLPLDAARERLAVRELVFTTHVADGYGAAPAATLMAAAKHAALAAVTTDQSALGAIVDRAVASAHTPLRSVTRAALIRFLTDLVAASSRYPDLRVLPPVHATSAFLAAASGSGQEATAPKLGQTLTGVAVAVANGALTAAFDGGSRTLGHIPAGLTVTRNGQSAHLGDVQPGDAVTVTTNAQGLMTRLDARAAPATPVGPTASSPGATSVDRGVVAGEGANSITYTTPAAKAPRTVAGWPGLTVLRDGRRARLADLRRGDAITIYRRPDGQVERLEARSAATQLSPTPIAPTPTAVTLTGTAARLTDATLALTETASGALRTVAVAPSARVQRDGQTARLADLRVGDSLTITLDPQGAAAIVDAQSSAAPFKAQPVAEQIWPFALLILLILCGVLLLALRYLPIFARPLSFVVVERRPDPTADAAAPATCELTRHARVICPDGEVGRLMHVAVIPRTGALLRLIVKDRADVMREVPANLIVSTSASVVRLSLAWPELQDLLQDRPAFSARRYKRLPVEHRRPADDAPLVQASADSLRIEIGGAPRL